MYLCVYNKKTRDNTFVLSLVFLLYGIILVNTPSHTQSTGIPSSDSNHDAPQSTLSETVAATPSTKQATSLFAPKYAYPSAFLPHPDRLRSKYQSNGRYGSGNAPQPFPVPVPDEFPRRV